MFEKIISFELIDECEVYDLEIDSKFHNFYANDIAVHNCAYSYITFQTLFFKVYYPAYFFAAMINVENDGVVFQQIVSDAKKNNVKIHSHSITKSRYITSVENGTDIRLGYNMIKGMGDAVAEELVNLKLHECSSLNEVLQKPFKKINSTMVQNLIDLGCFDEFGIERDKIEVLKELYQDPKVENWFTRTKQRLRLETIPKVLTEHFEANECLKMAIKVQGEDNPHVHLIDALIPSLKARKVNEEAISKKTSKKQQELIGFTLIKDNKLAKFEAAFSVKGILPLKEYDLNPTGDFYFCVTKKQINLTKTGKQYLQLTVNDGDSDFKVKCWKVLDISEGEVYYAKFKKDDYGLTMIDTKVFTI